MSVKVVMSFLLYCASWLLYGAPERVSLTQGSLGAEPIFGPFGALLPEEYFEANYAAVVAEGHGYSAQCLVLNKGRDKSLLIKNLKNDGRNYPFAVSIELPKGSFSNYFFEYNESSQMEIALEAEGRRLSEMMDTSLSTLAVIIYSAFPFSASLHDRVGLVNTLQVVAPKFKQGFSEGPFEDCCHPVTEGYHNISVNSNNVIVYAQLLVDRWYGGTRRLPDRSAEILYLGNLYVYFNGIDIHVPIQGTYCLWLEPSTPGLPDSCVSSLDQFFTEGNMGDHNYLTIWDDVQNIIYGTGIAVAVRPDGYTDGPAIFIIASEE